MIPTSERERAEQLSWSDIGLIHNQGVVAQTEHYKPAEVYQTDTDEDLGVEPVLVHHVSGAGSTWHLNQDIPFALDLVREGDVWVRPDENFVEVVRLLRDVNDKTTAMEMKAEHLKDYLAARNMALRVSRYFSRQAILANIDHLSWPVGTHSLPDDYRFEIRIQEIHEGGEPLGSSMAVVHVGRNDVDPEDDVPVLGPEHDGNIDHESWERKFEGDRLYRIESEFWIDEWLDPAEHSPRVRRDKIPSGCSFIVEPSGLHMNANDLDDEDVGRWLWFRPNIVPALLALRGTSLAWYTQETGNLVPCPGYNVHFGVNAQQLVNVYACDVAHLPEWQRRFWQGFNVSPEGGVSPELLSSQVRAVPAKTQAPEAWLERSIEFLNQLSEEIWGDVLFREHQEINSILQNAHRFRALDENGLFALAKDVNRLTTERLNIKLLHTISPPADNEKRGSLKSLEHVLGTLIEQKAARELLGPMVGIYELRVGDAHLPPSDIHDAKEMVGIDGDQHPISQGFQLLHSSVSALTKIGTVMRDAPSS